MRYAHFPLVLALSLVTSTAPADDGVIEINQTRAVVGGITPGDAPGFPVTINRAGSYRLTGDLVVTVGRDSLDGIVIAEDDVTLDLNGFSVSCTRSGDPLGPCSLVAEGEGDGIEVDSQSDARIRNGVVRGFPRHGIYTQQGSNSIRIEDVGSFENGVDGIEARANVTILRSQFEENGEYGIDAQAFHTLIFEVMTFGNDTAGIRDFGARVGVGRSLFDDGTSSLLDSALLECIIDGSTKRCP